MNLKKLSLFLVVVPAWLVPQPASSADDGRTAITATVKKRMPSFKLCFDDALKRRGHLDGKVVVDFEVGGDGRVSMSRVTQDTIKDPEVGCCAALLMRRIKFPPPARAPLRDSFPFVFVDPNTGAKPPKDPPPPTTYCADLKKLDDGAAAAP